MIRYNGYPAADGQGGPISPDVSAALTVAIAKKTAAHVLPQGMNIEFTGLTDRQVNQGNASLIVFPLCVLLVYWVLAALYESWLLPLSAILIVPMCLLSAVGGIWLLNTVKGAYFGLSIAAGWIPLPPGF